MKKLLILSIITMFFGFKSGQEIDEKRMNRDLEIARNILATLIKTGSDSFFGGTSIEASFIKDYGVVFTIPAHLVYFNGSGFPNPVVAPFPPVAPFDVQVNFQNDVLMQQKQMEVTIAQEKANQEQDKAMLEQEKTNLKQEKAMDEAHLARKDANIAKGEAELARRDTGEGYENGHFEYYVNYGGTEEINWEEIIITFMTDYADLIGQLQPEDKIVINQKSPFNEMFAGWEENEEKNDSEGKMNGISAEVLRKDILAFKTAKIDKDEFIRRININKKAETKKNADLEMFTSIFDRYYSRDLSETFFSEGKPNYEILDGFGALIHVRAISPGSGGVFFFSPGDNWTMEQKQTLADDEKLYQQFKENLKSFVLDYGRTVRSLGDTDKLRLEIKIQSCGDCKVPKMLEMTSDLSLLINYDQQKITKEKALAAIEIKELF